MQGQQSTGQRLQLKHYLYIIFVQYTLIQVFIVVRQESRHDATDSNKYSTNFFSTQRQPKKSQQHNIIITPTTLDDAIEYANSFTSLDRKLTFFHIPKTAGTAIENAAGENNINWGSCMFKHKPKRSICKYPGKFDWPRNVGYWHIPVQFFPIADTDPYSNSELFGVIRDPYERMVSEFYYICTLKVTDWRPDQCNRTRLGEKDYMNEWLRQKLEKRKSGSNVDDYLQDNGHFTPQYEYIMGPNNVRMLDYVLRLDGTLNSDFTKLMNAFKLDNVKLVKFNAIGAEAREETASLTVSDLDRDTLSHIHKNYPDDFENFLYNHTEL